MVNSHREVRLKIRQQLISIGYKPVEKVTYPKLNNPYNQRKHLFDDIFAFNELPEEIIMEYKPSNISISELFRAIGQVTYYSFLTDKKCYLVIPWIIADFYGEFLTRLFWIGLIVYDPEVKITIFRQARKMKELNYMPRAQAKTIASVDELKGLL